MEICLKSCMFLFSNLIHTGLKHLLSFPTPSLFSVLNSMQKRSQPGARKGRTRSLTETDHREPESNQGRWWRGSLQQVPEKLPSKLPEVSSPILHLCPPPPPCLFFIAKNIYSSSEGPSDSIIQLEAPGYG